MDERLCLDCGQPHQGTVEALACTERLADQCGCGGCYICHLAAWWRQQQYEEPVRASSAS